jgi:hypothetical protein
MWRESMRSELAALAATAAPVWIALAQRAPERSEA